MGVGFLGLQAHVANTDDVRKPRTLVREGKRKTPKKDALWLGSSPHGLYSLPDGTVCHRCVLVNTRLDWTGGERLSFWAIQASWLLLNPPPHHPWLLLMATKSRLPLIHVYISLHKQAVISEKRTEPSLWWPRPEVKILSNTVKHHTGTKAFTEWVWKWELAF